MVVAGGGELVGGGVLAWVVVGAEAAGAAVVVGAGLALVVIGFAFDL